MIKKTLIKFEVLEIIKEKEVTKEEIILKLSKYFEPFNIEESLLILLKENLIGVKEGKYFFKSDWQFFYFVL